MSTYQHCTDCGYDVDSIYQACPNCGSVALEEIDERQEQPSPYPDPADDPCLNGEHDWKDAFGGECSVCRVCGVYDC